MILHNIYYAQLRRHRRLWHISRKASRKRLAIASFGCVEALLPLLGLLPGAVDFLMRAIHSGSKMRSGALAFLLRSSETGIALRLEGVELDRLSIGHGL
jgi:hypothetical protein